MKKFLWLLLLVLFAGFIFFNSSLPAETSYKASGLLAQWLDSLYAAIGDPMPVDRLEARLRKLAHFVEFAVLAMIMVNTFISWRVSNRVASGYILFLGLAVAVADEYIQLSVPGRTAQVTDIVLDFRRLPILCLISAACSLSGCAAKYGCGAKSSAAKYNNKIHCK